LYLDLYVREYLAFNADVYKVAKERIEEVITTWLTESNKKKVNYQRIQTTGRISKCAASQS
jgi:3-methyladenine DNA glycosylase AlkC